LAAAAKCRPLDLGDFYRGTRDLPLPVADRVADVLQLRLTYSKNRLIQVSATKRYVTQRLMNEGRWDNLARPFRDVRISYYMNELGYKRVDAENAAYADVIDLFPPLSTIDLLNYPLVPPRSETVREAIERQVKEADRMRQKTNPDAESCPEPPTGRVNPAFELSRVMANRLSKKRFRPDKDPIWVLNNLDNPHVGPLDAPCMAAWSILWDARESPAKREQFMKTALALAHQLAAKEAERKHAMSIEKLKKTAAATAAKRKAEAEAKAKPAPKPEPVTPPPPQDEGLAELEAMIGKY